MIEQYYYETIPYEEWRQSLYVDCDMCNIITAYLAVLDREQRNYIVYERDDIYLEPESLNLRIWTDGARKGTIFIVANTKTTVNEPAYL